MRISKLERPTEVAYDVAEIEKVADAQEYLRVTVDDVDKIAQLAEEASELAQACVKWLRVSKGTNYAPMSVDQALDHIYEEFTDVVVASKVAGIYSSFGIESYKTLRWKERISENLEEGKDDPRR